MTIASRRLTVLVADDEPQARRTIRWLLRHEEQVESITEAASGEEVVEKLEAGSFDLLFLDIELGDLDGFEALQAVEPHRRPVVVFVTAYDEFALRAFEVEAVDYLLKPFTDERFRHAFERARAQIRAGSIEALQAQVDRLLDHVSAGRKWRRRILVRKAGRVLFLPVDEIDWFEAEDYYCRIHANGSSHLDRRSLASLEDELDPSRFFRTHRSAIVNLDRVRQIDELGRGDAIVRLADGSEVRLSRSRRAAFDEAMTGRG